jgi:hypothetical protein
MAKSPGNRAFALPKQAAKEGEGDLEHHMERGQPTDETPSLNAVQSRPVE